MSATVFVDTNVFVYSRDTTNRDKHIAATAWLSMLWEQQLGKTSYQVLNEYYVTVTTKLDRRIPLQQAREDIQDLLTWNPTQLTDTGLADAWTLQDRFGFSWWDTLILAAALTSACAYLLTEDLQHGQLIDRLKVISPFEVDPELILTV